MKDPELRRCTPAARGVWVDMLCLMFECPERGVLSSVGGPWNDQEIAASIAGETSVVLAAIGELIAKGVASRRSDGAIYSRRLVRDDRERKQTKERVKKHRCNADVTPPVTQMYEDEDEVEKEVVDLRKEKAIIGFELENFDADVHFEHLCSVYKKAERGYGAQTAFCEAIEYVVQHHRLTRPIAAGYIVSKAEKYCEFEQFQKGMTNWLRDKIFEQDESVWRRKENGIPHAKQSLEELYPDA